MQFSASQLADSLEAAEDVNERGNKRERDVIDNTWMRLSTVYDILQGTESAERRRAGTADITKLSAHAHQIEAAKAITENLRSLHMSEDVQVNVSNKNNSMTFLKAKTPVNREEVSAGESLFSKRKGAILCYKDFTDRKAQEWLRKLISEKKTRNRVKNSWRASTK